MNKTYDPNIQQKDVYVQYNNTYQSKSVEEAQDFIVNNNYIELALYSQYFNDLIQIENELQSFNFNEVFRYISLPPIKWVKGNNYQVGDKVFLNTPLDTQIYFCKKNVTNSVDVKNKDYWIITTNYYTVDNLTYIFQQWINRLQIYDYPQWDSSVTYFKNNIVINNFNVYICITKSPQGTTANLEDTNNWLLLDIRGLKGINSTGISYKGIWSAGTQYNINDMVVYKNNNVDSVFILISEENDLQTPPPSSNNWKQGVVVDSVPLSIYDDEYTFSEVMAFWKIITTLNINSGQLIWNVSQDNFIYNKSINWIKSSSITGVPVVSINIDESQDDYWFNRSIVQLNNISYQDGIYQFVINVTQPSKLFSLYQICNFDYPITYWGMDLYINGVRMILDEIFPLNNCKYLLTIQQDPYELIDMKIVELPINSYYKCSLAGYMTNTYTTFISSDNQIPFSGTAVNLSTLLTNFYKILIGKVN